MSDLIKVRVREIIENDMAEFSVILGLLEESPVMADEAGRLGATSTVINMFSRLWNKLDAALEEVEGGAAA